MTAESTAGTLLGTLVNQNLGRRPSTSELIAATLREAIIRGTILPGAQLRQSEVAAEFGVSSIPVREALLQLEAQGFVTIHHNRGAVVPEILLEEIAELFDIRIVLETMIIRLAIPLLDENGLRKAEEYSCALDNEPDVNRWGTWNWMFHEALYAPAGRRRTISILSNLHNHIDRVLRLQMSLEGGKSKAHLEHNAILQACWQKDAERAASLLETHIRSVRDIVLRFAAEQSHQISARQFTPHAVS